MLQAQRHKALYTDHKDHLKTLLLNERNMNNTLYHETKEAFGNSREKDLKTLEDANRLITKLIEMIDEE